MVNSKAVEWVLRPIAEASWADRVIVAALLPVAVAEWWSRESVVWPYLTLALGLASVASILLRRTHPLTVVVLAFGAQHAVRLASTLTGAGWKGLFTMIGIIVLPFSLTRRCDPPRALFGLAVIMVGPAMMVVRQPNAYPEGIAASALLLFPAALGASARARDLARQRELERAKAQEREQLARELHDTVAHHMSAVIVQAQAGRTLADEEPEAAVSALEIIEEAATRTLDEMRRMVRALRNDGPAALAPLPGLSDIFALTERGPPDLRIDVHAEGDLARLDPTLAAALYRLAQESVTNAGRHARDATQVVVRIVASDDRVSICVRDDGRTGSARAESAPGFGLVGMAERTKLLGGTFAAGPTDDGGWTVEADFPLRGHGR